MTFNANFLLFQSSSVKKSKTLYRVALAYCVKSPSAPKINEIKQFNNSYFAV